MKWSEIIGVLDGVLHLPQWWMQKLQHRDANIWIFGAWNGTRYSDNSRAFYEYITANHPEIYAVWITRSSDVYHMLRCRNMRVEMADSKPGRSIQRRAGVCFYSWGVSDVNETLLNGCRLINLWHGMPLKMIGKDEMRFKYNYTWWKKLKVAWRKVMVPWDYLSAPTIATSKFFSPFLQSAFALPEADVWDIGCPRNDWLLQDGKCEKRISEMDDRWNHPVKVLYMPTFRDVARDHNQLFNPFAMANCDLEELNMVLERKNMVLLYKGHFCDSMNMVNGGDRIMTVGDSDYDNLYSFLRHIDVLITDYSSVYFDFLLCKKPILLFPFDEEEYRRYSRPFYFDYSLMRAPRVYSWKELCEVLDEAKFALPTEDEIRLFCGKTEDSACERLYNKVMA